VPPQKTDNDNERLERLKARLEQLRIAGRQAQAKLRKPITRRNPKKA
jgi:hypothetical protein